jgi:hypothetical protein
MMSIFAAWAIPFLQSAGGSRVTSAWQDQLLMPLTGFKFEGWIRNIPRSLGYFLPWLALIPLVAGGKFSSERKTRIMRGLSWGIAVPLVIMDLTPGWLPRYSMPLIGPAAWLLAATLTADDLTWPRWLGGKKFLPQDRQRTVAATVLITCVCVLIYACAIVPHLQKRPKIKPIAGQINALVPASERLYVVDPDYQPFLFYVRGPLIYVGRVGELPRETRYFLVQSKNDKDAEEAQQWSPLRPRRILAVEDYRHWKSSLFVVDAP